MFEKILIANRGEIALRVIRACKELGVRTLAVYSEADVDSLHVQLADEAICIGAAAEFGKLFEDRPHHERGGSRRRRCDPSRLRIPGGERALRRSLRELPDQIHRSARRARCTRWATKIPPAPLRARPASRSRRAATASSETEQEALKVAKKVGFPVMIKAVAGGGGRGMRAAHNEASLVPMFHAAKTEAEKAFGNGDVYIEKLIVNPHHIEFQIMADSYGKTVHLGERDCSIQRRNQKVIEECPSPLLTPALRKKMGNAAVKLAQSVGYENAGTMEFLVDNEGHYYFIEMNTRIQVEHTITEEVYGCDLVKEQIKIAAGEHLSPHVANAIPRSHAIQCRINAEDPEQNFQPSPGRIAFLLCARRTRRAHRFACLHRLRRAAVLRFDDREIDHRGAPRASRRSIACAARSTNITSPASRRRCRSTARSCATPISVPATTTPASSSAS